ncbi:MAG: sulfatase-like hydrolase/transferase [Planctomycetota bacterium]
MSKPYSRRISIWLISLACSAGWLVTDQVRGAEKRPNLIAIVTDDQGRWALGAYGNREIHTPNLDRIGREGAIFSHAFVVTPVCSPSRATYFSGLYPTEHGISDYLAPVEEQEGQGLHAPIWPKVLQHHGYKTALVGKWHLGSKPEFHPTKKGFDRFIGFLGGGNTPMNAILEIDGKTTKTEGPLPDRLTDAAIAFIRENKDFPFALCLHFRAPHLPYGPVPEIDSSHYASLDPTVPNVPGLDLSKVKASTRAYYASISSVDRNVGRLLAELDSLKLAENTLLFFTSDHGYNEGRHGVDTKGNAQWIAGGVRGPKRPNMWDTSIRVPLLVRWPSVVKAGSTVDEQVSNLDMYRTVLGAVDLPLPENCKAHGIDYSPLLRGKTIEKHDALFGPYDLHNGGLAYMRMIRTPRYKLIRHFRANFLDEFYDLTKDPGEERNLLGGPRAQDWPAPARELNRRLNAFQQSINDPILPAGNH